ncbi:MAG TPA: hypothetical protein VJ183_01470 [Chloroflexia bacterium]|nr:hypothetical protein [Chloroflexia bacterium]
MPLTSESDLLAINSIFYAGGQNISIVLNAAPAQPVMAALFKGAPTGTDYLASATSTYDRVNIRYDSSKLDPLSSYTVALALDPSSPPTWGPGTTLVFQQPTLTRVAIVHGAVEIGWTLPPVSSIEVVRAVLYDSARNALVVEGTSPGLGARLVPPTPLDPGGNYTVFVQGINGVASGPQLWMEDSLVLTVPALANAVYAAAADGYTITVTEAWAPGPPSIPVAQLLSDGQIVAQQAATGQTAVINLTAPLDPASRWRVRLLYQYQASTTSPVILGPPGVTADIPLQQAQVTSALYDGTQFHITWAMPSGEPGASGGAVVIQSSSDKVQIGAKVVSQGFSADITPDVAVDPTVSYQVLIAPVLGSVQGLPGPPVSLIVAPPQLASVTSNGEQAFVQTKGPVPGATGTLLLLNNAVGVTGTILSTPGGPAGGLLALPNVGLTVITVAAQAVSQNVAGPVSQSTPVLSTVPSFSGIELSDGVVTGMATIPSAGLPLQNSNVQLWVYVDGVTIVGPQLVRGDTNFSIPVDSSTGGLTVRGVIVGEVGGVGVEGPLSPPVPVLTTPAQITGASLTYLPQSSQWQLAAKWSSPDEAVTSFKVTLAQGGSSLAEWTVQGTSLQMTAPGFDASKPLTLSLTPLGNFGNGPTGSPASFLATVPALSAVCGRDRIRADWSAPAGVPANTQVSAYRLRLMMAVLQDKDATPQWFTVAQSEACDGTSATLPLPDKVVAGDDDSGTTIYGLTVDVAFGIAWTASNSVTPVLTTAPLVSVAGGPTQATLSWTWPSGAPPVQPAPTDYQVIMLRQGCETVLASQETAPGSVTTKFTTLPQDARLGIRARATGVVGPLSSTLPVVTSKATVLAASANSSTILVDFTPSIPPAPEYQAALFKNGNIVASTPAIASPVAIPFAAAQPGVAYSVKILTSAEQGLSTGPGSDPLPVVLVPPSLSAPTANAATLSVGVAPPDTGGVSLTGYRADLVRDGIVVQSVSGLMLSGGRLTIPAGEIDDLAGSYSLRVYALAANAIGPYGAATPVVLGSPLVTVASVAFGAQGLVVTVTVDPGALPGEGLILEAVLVADGKMGTPVQVSGGQASLTVPSPGTVWSVGARARVADATGPWSSYAAPVMVPPGNVSVAWNGRQAAVSWEPLPMPQVTGYLVTILDGTNAVQTLWTAGSSTLLHVAFDATRSFTAVVQATTVDSAGQPSAAVSLFQPGTFISSSGYPYAFRAVTAALTPQDMAHDINIYLPTLGTLKNLPLTQGAFTLAANQDQGTKTTFPYVLTIQAKIDGTLSEAWNFDAVPRPRLQSDYVAFLKAAEQSRGVSAAGISALQEAISRSMPQTFPEMLYYAYGLDLANNWADLRPGMVLRVAYDGFINIPGPTTPRWLSGYSGGPVVDYDVVSYLTPGGDWMLGLDAFFAQVVANGVMEVDPPEASALQMTEAGLADVADLFFSAFRQPFYRLFFPAKLMSPSGIGSVLTSSNFVIAAASSYTQISNAKNYPAPGNTVAYFRGRVVVHLCIRVVVNGVNEIVPIGTTVGNILERYGNRAPSTTLALDGLKLDRSTGAGVLDPTTPYAVGGSTPVRLDWLTMPISGTPGDALSLPLLHGDRLTIGG